MGGWPALADHQGSAVPTYTGCLDTAGAGKGKINKIRAGQSPIGSNCRAGFQEIHLSSGDITAITDGTGLSGGGTSGGVILSVAPTYRLPQSCPSSSVAVWNGSAWDCGAPTPGLVVIPRSLVTPTATASTEAAARTAATAVPMLTQGNLSIYAKCFSVEPDPNVADDEAILAEIYAATSVDGALLSSSEDDLDDGAPFLDDDTAETSRQLGALLIGADSIDIDNTPSEEGFLVLGPDGTALRGQIYVGGKQGDPVGGNGLFGAGDKCIFGGYTTVG